MLYLWVQPQISCPFSIPTSQSQQYESNCQLHMAHRKRVPSNPNKKILHISGLAWCVFNEHTITRFFPKYSQTTYWKELIVYFGHNSQKSVVSGNSRFALVAILQSPPTPKKKKKPHKIHIYFFNYSFSEITHIYWTLSDRILMHVKTWMYWNWSVLFKDSLQLTCILFFPPQRPDPVHFGTSPSSELKAPKPSGKHSSLPLANKTSWFPRPHSFFVLVTSNRKEGLWFFLAFFTNFVCHGLEPFLTLFLQVRFMLSSCACSISLMSVPLREARCALCDSAEVESQMSKTKWSEERKILWGLAQGPGS